jgi:uncharacterized protein YlxW (UPF0749 family)
VPDASVTLLSELMVDTLDAGYAEAAARRGTAPARSSRVGVVVGLVLTGLLLAAAVTEVRERQSGANAVREQLVKEAEARTAAADRAAADLVRLRAQISRARRDALALSGSGDGGGGELDRLELATGAVPVAGPGLLVTLDDPKRPPGGSDVRDDEEAPEERILDRDLQGVVNGLWAAGAEAISINDQRLTALSAIRAADIAILVDYRPLAPPYVVRAVGDPETLERNFVAGRNAREMRALADNLGFRFDLTPNPRLSLPAASGLSLRSARPDGVEG